MTVGTDQPFGDRHLRPDPDGRLADTPVRAGSCVRIVLDSAVAQTLPAQLAAWLCVNLVARLDGLVGEIVLDVPDVLAHPRVQLQSHDQPKPDAKLASCLTDLCVDVAGDRIGYRVSVPGGHPVTAQIIVGGEPARESADLTIWCAGAGWRAYAGRTPPQTLPQEAAASHAIGWYFAVCMAVGEVFKHLKGLRQEYQRYVIESLYTSIWTGTHNDTWDFPDGPDVAGLRLPATYVVGGGAVGQAACFVAATTSAGCDYVTVVDREFVDHTNRNRYLLTSRRDEGAQKAHHLTAYLTRLGIDSYAVPKHWIEAISRLESHPDPTLAQNERAHRYALVLSCVDKEIARQEIQRTWPRDLLGGSTFGLRSTATYYDMRTPTACLACFNTPPSYAEMIQSLRRQLHAAPPTEHPAVLIRNGIDEAEVAAVLAQLAEPRCGELGESALQRFTESGPPAFAVGFVSVAAGILLARHWMAYTIGSVSTGREWSAHSLNVNFFNGRMIWVEQHAREGCVCESDRHEIWRELWQ